MANKEYSPITVPFLNRGLNLKNDPSGLADGQFQDLENIVSIQEGSIQSRLGASRFSAGFNESFPHSVALLRTGAADADQYFYIGAGGNIYRMRKSVPGTVTQMSGVSLPSWGQRWTSCTYQAGQSSKPWFYVAASAMLKDDLSSTTFKRWGILPPKNACTATKGGNYSTTIDNGDSPSRTWAAGETTIFQSVVVRSTDIDLSAFTTPSAAASGVAGNFYDSDDFIELKFTFSNYDSFQQVNIQFDCGDGSYADTYFRAMAPYQTPELKPSDPNSLDSVRNSWVMYEKASGAANQQITVKIPKKEFARTGSAGTSTANWSTVAAVRFWVLAKDTGATFTVNSVKLIGGSGPDNSSGTGALPYSWVYTYRNGNTGHESNPSMEMVPAKQITSIQREAVTITDIAYSSDPQVTTIAIYRAGGTYTDGMYRLVGYTTNSVSGGVEGGTTTFADALADPDIVYAPTVEFDNDPPVLSTLPTSYEGSFTGPGTHGAHVVTMTGNVQADSVLTVGTNLTIYDGDKSETVRVITISGNNVEAWFQLPHSGTIRVTCEAVTGIPCRLSVAAHDSIFLAGDQNNPHVLYKSKSGRPESFPVITEATGVANQVIVGSQSNPIVAVADLNGEVVCLNLRSVYIVRVFNGQMQVPIQAPTSHGLITSAGWCKAEGFIAYLSNDGVYAWAGAGEEKISEEIDWFFKGQTANGRKPMSFATADLDWVRMEYYRNKIRLLCKDTDGRGVQVVYDTVYKRWHFEMPAVEESSNTYISTLLATNEGLYSSRTIGTTSYLYLEEQGTADNSVGFSCFAQTGWYTLGSPSVEKQFGDILLEVTSPNQTITIKTYYNYSATVDETLTITGAAGRRLIPLPIQSGAAKQARAIAFRFEFTSASASAVVLHSMTFNVLPLAELQRGRAGDWMDGGYPYDKRLSVLNLEYDTAGQNVTLNLDTLSGIDGDTYTAAVTTYTLNSTTGYRGIAALPIIAANGSAVVCKAWRLRPTAATTDFKIFNANIDFERYPADIIRYTEWRDFGWKYEKVIRNLQVEIDTGGVACSIELQADGATVQTFSATTTDNDRARIFSVTSTISNTATIGKLFRLKLTPGTNGKAQLFSWDLDRTLEPAPQTHWDSFEQSFGSDGYSYIKQMWIEYRCGGRIRVDIYVDGGNLFYSKELPAQAYRNTARWYLPAVSSGILNKSKSYRFVVEALDGEVFHLYRDGTRVESLNLSAGSRAGYLQHMLWEDMPLVK